MEEFATELTLPFRQARKRADGQFSFRSLHPSHNGAYSSFGGIDRYGFRSSPLWGSIESWINRDDGIALIARPPAAVTVTVRITN